MASHIRHITVDCHDPYALAQFWGAALGFVEEAHDPNLPGMDETLVIDPAGQVPGVLFIRVPEGKTAKNRVHLDLQPDGTRDGTVAELIDLGAAVVEDHRLPDGRGWVVMADPEGNEFCVERSAAERAATGEPEPTPGPEAAPGS